MNKKTYLAMSLCFVLIVSLFCQSPVYAKEDTIIPLTSESAALISEGKIRLEDGHVDSLLYQGKILSPDEDDDGDSIPNSQEIYTYIKDNRTYYGYYSHPLLYDTDGDGLSDKEDKEPLSWDISLRDMVLFMELVYREDGYITKVLDDTKELTDLYDNRLEYSMMHKELSKFWKVKEFHHLNEGFDAVLFETKSKYPYLKDGSVQVLGIRGTQGSGDIDDDMAIFFGTTPKQAAVLQNLLQSYEKNHSVNNLYVTGHSLGGHLAQRGLVAAKELGYDWYKKAYTFNAPKIKGNLFNGWLNEIANKGDELTRKGIAVHHIVDNDSTISAVGTFDGAISVGSSKNRHGSRTYFESIVNDKEGFSVGKRKGMDGTGYEDEKLKDLNFNETLTDAKVYTDVKVTEEKILIGEKANLTDNLIGLPKDVKIKDITDYKAIHLNQKGRYKGTVLVTFSDGSQTDFDIPIIVSETEEREAKTIYVRNGGVDDLSGDGSKEFPYGSILHAMKHSIDGDTIILTEDITLNGTEDLIIKHKVTIDGENHGIYLRGHDLVLEDDSILKDISLRFLTDGAVNVESLNVGKIIVNDHELTMDNVSTLISKKQNDDRPILVAGKISSDKEGGSGAKITLLNATSETRFNRIILGNLSGEKNTPTTLKTDGFALSDEGIIASGFHKEKITEEVTVELGGGKISTIVNADKAAAVHVSVGEKQSIYGADFTKITDLTLKEGASVTLKGEEQDLGSVTIKKDASLNLQDTLRVSTQSIETDGKIHMDPNRNHLIIRDKITGNGVIYIRVWEGEPKVEEEIIYFPNGNASDINTDIWDRSYTLKKTDTGYSLSKIKVTMEKDLYEPKLPKDKLEVTDINSLSKEEEKTLLDFIKKANEGYLPESAEYLFEGEEGVIILYSDSSEDVISLDKLIIKKEETPEIPKESIELSLIEEVPEILKENVLEETVYIGEDIHLEDNIKDLPSESSLEVLETVTSEKTGSFEGKVKVTFENGSSRIVTIPVTVKDRVEIGIVEEIPEIPKENILEEIVYKGEAIHLEDNIKDLPNESKVEVLETVTSEKAGNFEGKVKVIFDNGSSRIVTIPVTVKDRVEIGIVEEVPEILKENILEETVYKGEVINLEDNIKDLPSESKVEVLETVTSEKTGSFEGKVKVTFENGSSRIVTIPVTVKDRVEISLIEEVPEIPKENILEETVYKGEVINLEDNIKDL
ncbi:Rib/alpha-like domain-containing protein, partial [Streptococcus suis]|uniref:Rib/alpha-like domain-containing protein n=1 Tax=Streptococcus suis TaxID=1307 RepID=UPI001E4BD05A